MSFTHLDHATLHQWLLDGKSLNLVDIRDPVSFSNGHISASRHLDNLTLTEFMEEADPEQPLVVVCYHGNSSQGAAGWLAQQGFVDVYSLDGGFTEWQQQYPDQVEQ